jgi:hypothetical protein
MAVTAVISLPHATVPYNRSSVAVVTISNGGDSAVTLSDLRPVIGANRGINTGINQSNQSQPITPLSIPASGSAITTFTINAFAPQVVPFSSETPTTYSIGANLITSDGQSIAATPATLTISPPSAN